MAPMFVEMLPRRPSETDAELERLMNDDIMRLNGKQTIYQMIQLAERIRERGGQPHDPLVVQARVSATIGRADPPPDRRLAKRPNSARRLAGSRQQATLGGTLG